MPAWCQRAWRVPAATKRVFEAARRPRWPCCEESASAELDFNWLWVRLFRLEKFSIQHDERCSAKVVEQHIAQTKSLRNSVVKLQRRELMVTLAMLQPVCKAPRRPPAC